VAAARGVNSRSFIEVVLGGVAPYSWFGNHLDGVPKFVRD
jgi:hypothetical protein